ncbi:MAG: hypothetical protein KDC54_02935, partial [Lewinella sp.]|nr:hypothetical protein [Lewinella sp.]
MKTPSPFLYDLVQRLTQSEKRYLRVRAGGSEKDYLRLMDALLAQPAFDEELLLSNHADANFAKHLAVNKRYLYDTILKALAHFGPPSAEDKVREKIAATQVLMGKGLLQAARSELRKGQRLAEKFELFALRVTLCQLEKRLLGKLPPGQQDEQ